MSQSTTSALPTTKPTLILAITLGALPGLFLLITSTTHLVEGEFVYDIKRLLQLCLLLILFLAATINPGLRNAFAQQFNRIPGWVQALLGLIIVLGITSSAVNATSGMHLAYSLLEVALLSMLVMAVLVIAACRALAGELFDQVAITLLALTAIAVGIQELLGVAAAVSQDLEYFFRISLMHYSWPRFYNQAQAWTLPVLAALPLIWSRSKSELLQSTWFQACVCLTALALHWYIILMTGGRGVALSLLVSFVICLLVFPATRKVSLKWHLPGLILGALIFFAVLHLMGETAQERGTSANTPTATAQEEGVNPRDHFAPEQGGSRFSRQSISGRISLDSSGRWWMWRQSLEDIKAHPILGNGPMNYACTGPKYRAGHPHNFAVQFAGEWGLPATMGLLAVLVFVAVRLWSQRKRLGAPSSHQTVQALLIVGALGAAAYSMLSGVLVMPASLVAGILVSGWLMGAIPASTASPEARMRPVFVLLIGSIISLGVTVFSYVESEKRTYREALIERMDAGIPRYWQQGKICKYFDRY